MIVFCIPQNLRMTILICICDLQYQQEYLQIDNNNHLKTLPRGAALSRTRLTGGYAGEQRAVKGEHRRTLRRVLLHVEGVGAFYLLREIQQFTQFRLLMCANPALRDVDVLWLQLLPPAKEIIDYKWNRMLAHTLCEKIEVDYLMSWLSTLGGGYSALGEQFSECAQTAGKISLKQLSIGLRLGDPFLQARCKLYYSISLIQMGRLRHAKYIVRDQYKFAAKQKEIDGRLVNMCEGVWLRLQYEYGQRRRRLDGVELLLASDDNETVC